MSEHTNVGKQGEEIVANYLVNKGYSIVERNWRYGKKEIDIIARYNNTIVFVEVKTRSSLQFELPQEAVTIKKMRNIVVVADAYMRRHCLGLEGRFDIVAVHMSNPPKIIEHIESAVLPNELL